MSTSPYQAENGVRMATLYITLSYLDRFQWQLYKNGHKMSIDDINYSRMS